MQAALKLPRKRGGQFDDEDLVVTSNLQDTNPLKSLIYRSYYFLSVFTWLSLFPALPVAILGQIRPIRTFFGQKKAKYGCPGKFWGGQVQSGQNDRASVRTPDKRCLSIINTVQSTALFGRQRH